MAESKSGSTLGDLLRKQRELAAIPMRQLARMAGISGPYLSQIERGLRAPSDQVLTALADNLQISVDVLRSTSHTDAADKDDSLLAAIRREPRLTPAQRTSLEQVYLAFLASNDQATSADEDSNGSQ